MNMKRVIRLGLAAAFILAAGLCIFPWPHIVQAEYVETDLWDYSQWWNSDYNSLWSGYAPSWQSPFTSYSSQWPGYDPASNRSFVTYRQGDNVSGLSSQAVPPQFPIFESPFGYWGSPGTYFENRLGLQGRTETYYKDFYGLMGTLGTSWWSWWASSGTSQRDGEKYVRQVREKIYQEHKQQLLESMELINRFEAEAMRDLGPDWLIEPFPSPIW